MGRGQRHSKNAGVMGSEALTYAERKALGYGTARERFGKVRSATISDTCTLVCLVQGAHSAGARAPPQTRRAPRSSTRCTHAAAMAHAGHAGQVLRLLPHAPTGRGEHAQGRRWRMRTHGRGPHAARSTTQADHTRTKAHLAGLGRKAQASSHGPVRSQRT